MWYIVKKKFSDRSFDTFLPITSWGKRQETSVLYRKRSWKM